MSVKNSFILAVYSALREMPAEEVKAIFEGILAEQSGDQSSTQRPPE